MSADKTKDMSVEIEELLTTIPVSQYKGWDYRKTVAYKEAVAKLAKHYHASRPNPAKIIEVMARVRSFHAS
jgi:hypothetical protein